MAGYDPDFLPEVTIPLPELLPSTLAQAYEGGVPIDHEHHSVVFNQMRGLAVYSAHNVDGDRLVSGIDRRGFTLDPKVPKALQIDDDRGYRGFPTEHDNPWDAGHLARRIGVHWPDRTTAEKAERETAHWTNIAPQHHELNQGPWLQVEDWLLDLADDTDKRMSVFTGPVFSQTDLDWLNKSDELPIKIPSGYWKVAVIRHHTELCAAAFLIWQTDVHPSPADFDPDRFDPTLEQVRVLTVEHLAGISFGDTIRAADPLRFGRAADGFGPPARMGEITEAGDLCL